MIHATDGNLLEADAEALVNTVNTVGVMGKGIALMFKERFPENFRRYAAACKREEVQTGRVFAVANEELAGPHWIYNFPTKRHWRSPSRLEWIDEGLADLAWLLREHRVASVAVPPLGAGNGGLKWADVRPLVERHLGSLPGVDVLLYEPTQAYQNVSKTTGKERLTLARALVAEMVRRYGVLGLDCSILEIQKLAWVLQRQIRQLGLDDPLELDFKANRYGPYSDRLRHLLDALDGSWLRSEKRLADAEPPDTIRFAPGRERKLGEWFGAGQGFHYREAVEATDALIDGFQSPLGLEALATVGWLLDEEGVEPSLAAVREGIARWPAGPAAAERKAGLFGDHLLEAAIRRYTHP
ncbi:type II toxin-antitoxin system antitoxin DNA ADP-ribosyl glycohydrolase DarG [Phycisphaera mikurensis]|uniref:Macro domain-containing protein n=1 Tax=Phycisphaera mikurensis (strain NBRC 102666 / KCTC 22515 / FYK2301M01) TaxID=1142394 RepID=I0II64_PHYMF|nr:macro domain-containing protein [Phycisphaera mikurensis]MBB6442485.1 O-acetyl-ADP-ribose deacetylase (regulator of RNase III) [Phycisphaera mikurensis]BAM04952.1 hypothetical protein PSMK_27930 [Phycisphaera mikurensis NBRC 102666]